MDAEPVWDYIIVPHALLEMKRRGLSEELVRSALAAPEERLGVRAGRDVIHLRVQGPAQGKTYLLRVFIDVDRMPAEVVTAYLTSKVAKYWRGGQ